MVVRLLRWITLGSLILIATFSATLASAGLKFSGQSVETLRTEARLGNVDAQVELGMAYQLGKGITTDVQLAKYWYERAALFNHRVAQFNLATILHAEGKDGQAFQWLAKSAANGLAEAQHGLSVFYRDGISVEVDYKKAARWLKPAAEQGLADAQYGLGVVYDRGRGVKMNKTSAVAWWLRAAAQGHVDAQYNLGIAYQYGEGAAIDLADAAGWYERAAKRGHGDAQMNLGALYANGKGRDKDLVQALMWISLAADVGVEGAGESQQNLEAFMREQDVEASMDLVKQFVLR